MLIPWRGRASAKFANSFVVEVKASNSNTAKFAKWAATSRDLMPDDHQKVFGWSGQKEVFLLSEIAISS